MALEIEKLSPAELDQLAEALRTREREKRVKAAEGMPKVGMKSPRAPEAGAKPLWGIRYDPEAIHQRIADSGGELCIASGKNDRRAFADCVRNFERTVDNELARGTEQEWAALDERARDTIRQEILQAATYIDSARRRLETGGAQLKEMLAALDAIELPKMPLATRVADGVKDIIEKLAQPMFRTTSAPKI
jgi:hypothetical protein